MNSGRRLRRGKEASIKGQFLARNQVTLRTTAVKVEGKFNA